MDAVGVAINDELLTRLIDSLLMLRDQTEDVILEKERFGSFSKYLSLLRTLLQELHAKRVDTKPEWPAMRIVLQKLEAQVKSASDTIKNYSSKSRLHLLLNCQRMFFELQRLSEEICRTIEYLNLGTLDSTMQLKSQADGIICGLESIEFKSAVSSEAIVTEIEKSIFNNRRSRDYRTRLLQQIADALGVSPTYSLVKREIAILKQEKEELESRKLHAEALQASQLIQLLYATEMVSSPRPESPLSLASASLISSFTCEISGEIMEDPVAIVCGHSFERKAISQYFELGQATCPTCGEVLSSLELTRNISLKNSIQEWQHRNVQHKLKRAVSSLASNQTDILNQALEDILTVMEMPGYVTEVSQLELLPKLIFLLNVNAANSQLVLKCLYHLGQYSQQNKECIAAKGVIRCIVKHFCSGVVEPEALEILLALSENEKLADQVGNTKDCIPTLVSLLQLPDPTISQTAQKVLDNLSSKTPFVIKMVEAEHFNPFVAHFNQVNSEERALMASTLARMQLSEISAKNFENDVFIRMLTKSLYSSVCKPACLRCLKKLSAFPRMVKMLVSDKDTIPALLGMVNSSLSEPQWKQEAVEILSSLVEGSEPDDCQNNPSLDELYSLHNIHFFLQMASSSVPQTMASCLRLLILMTQKNADARELIQSDAFAICQLFSILVMDQHSDVRLAALQLTISISDHNPAGLVLPPVPLKETVISTVISIFISSPNTLERSVAARVIARLPSSDTTIDDMLLQSEVLKMIQEIICAPENKHQMMMTEPQTTSESNHLLESTLAVLLRFTDPTKHELQERVLKIGLHTQLVQVLSTGSYLAKEHAIIALSNLQQLRKVKFIDSEIKGEVEKKDFFPFLHFGWLLQLKSFCGSATPVPEIQCTAHGPSCCERRAFCLVREGALRPLLQIVNESEPCSSGAALAALADLLLDKSTVSHATSAIVENKGVTAIIKLLRENCPIATKEKALDILLKIINHPGVSKEHSLRSRDVLISLLKVDELKKKAALVLSEMGALPEQSTYF